MTTYSRVEYPDLDGSIGSFVIPFQFFRASDLEVYLDGELVGTEFFSVVGTNIEFLAGYFPVGRLMIRRVTDLTNPEARFSSNSQIRPGDLNDAIDQPFFVVQELVDGFTGLGVDFTADGSFVLPKTAVGLENVDNTSDADKPISTATQAALDLKLDADVLSPSNIFQIVIDQSGGTSGVNATRLNGFPASYYTDYRFLTNVPDSFTPAEHVHDASDITSGKFNPLRISVDGVKQHEQLLTIDYTQLANVPPGRLGEVTDGKTYLRTQGRWVEFDPEENEILSGLGISLSDILGD